MCFLNTHGDVPILWLYEIFRARDAFLCINSYLISPKLDLLFTMFIKDWVVRSTAPILLKIYGELCSQSTPLISWDFRTRFLSNLRAWSDYYFSGNSVLTNYAVIYHVYNVLWFFSWIISASIHFVKWSMATQHTSF